MQVNSVRFLCLEYVSGTVTQRPCPGAAVILSRRPLPLLIFPLLLAGCLNVVPPKQEKEPDAVGGNAAPAAQEEKKPNALQREAKLVDRNQWLKDNPDGTEIEKNVINASDPFSATAQGYFAAASQLTISALKHDLDLWHTLNEKWPTFAEYQEILTKHGVKLKGLKKGQVYAYDDQTGNVSILQEPTDD